MGGRHQRVSSVHSAPQAHRPAPLSARIQHPHPSSYINRAASQASSNGTTPLQDAGLPISLPVSGSPLRFVPLRTPVPSPRGGCTALSGFANHLFDPRIHSYINIGSSGHRLLITNNPFYRTTAYEYRRGPHFPAFMNMNVPYLGEITPFLERNPVIAIILTLILLRSVRALCNRLLEYSRKR